MLCIHKDSKINVEKMQKIKDSNFHPMKKQTKKDVNNLITQNNLENLPKEKKTIKRH